MNEILSMIRKSGPLIMFEDGIGVKQLDRGKSRLTFCPQKDMEITICHADRTKMYEWSAHESKQRQEGVVRSKIGKSMLRQCFGSVVNCLSQIMYTLNILSMQIVHLYAQTRHQIIFSILQQKTIEPAIETINSLPKQSTDDLNYDFSQLLCASRQISKRISYFKKEFISKKPHYELPSHSKIFNAYLQ